MSGESAYQLSIYVKDYERTYPKERENHKTELEKGSDSGHRPDSCLDPRVRGLKQRTGKSQKDSFHNISMRYQDLKVALLHWLCNLRKVQEKIAFASWNFC